MKNTFKGIFIALATLGLVAIMGSGSPEIKKVENDSQPLTHSFNQNYHIASPPLPENPNFAGETIPISKPDVLEKLEREFLVNTYWQSNMSLMIKRAGAYFPIIEPILAEEGVPDDFKYLAMAESGLTQAKSPAGARGFWQFMTATAKIYDLEVRNGLDERYHVAKATKAACAYLKKSKEKFGSWTLAAAAYNRGENGLSKALNDQHVKSYYDLYLNPETARYVYRIAALKYIHQNQEKYGFRIPSNQHYALPKTYLEKVESSIDDLPKWALDRGTNYKIVRFLNPWIRSYSLSVPTGKTYYIQLPEPNVPAEDE